MNYKFMYPTVTLTRSCISPLNPDYVYSDTLSDISLIPPTLVIDVISVDNVKDVYFLMVIPIYVPEH